jgi:hypothetical protein
VETDRNVVIALPGPPRELEPMWRDHALPRLHARGLGTDRAAETLRLAGIGESAVVDLIGEAILRIEQPQVATYARVDAVDLRVSAVGEPGRSARTIVDETVARLMPLVGPYVFARGEEGWPDALQRRLGTRRIATVEIGTAGQLGALLGTAPWLAAAELIGPGGAFGSGSLGAASGSLGAASGGLGAASGGLGAASGGLGGASALPGGASDLPGGASDGMTLERLAGGARTRASVDIGLAVEARPSGDDMRVIVAVDVGGDVTRSEHTVFRGGDIGRRRAANTACAALWARLGDAAVT